MKAKTKPTNWAIYCRVSTDGQEKDGLGLEVQEAACRKYLEDRGLDCVGVWHDVCSGTLQDRPKLADLMLSCDQDRIAGVIVLRLDRLAREAIVQETILQRFARHEVLVRSTQESENLTLDDPSADPDPTRKFMRLVLAAANELERALITQRTMAAKRRIAAAGGHHAGPMPNGMYVNPHTKRLEFTPVVVPVLADGLWMRARGCSAEAVGEYFMQSGFRPKRARRWLAKPVDDTLKRARKVGITESPTPSVLAATYVRTVERMAAR